MMVFRPRRILKALTLAASCNRLSKTAGFFWSSGDILTGYLDPLKMRSIFISGFSDTLDWRPLYFQESSVAHMVCSLCGVVSRNVVRLPCEHTLCSECHEESQRRGSTCPLDEESFADDNILHLDISGGYILNHTVACVNAPNGCDFIGQASRLVDHYKQCSFHVVPCPRCQSSVLRTELVGFFWSSGDILTGYLDPLKMRSTFISGFSDTLDWRPLYFQESSVANIVCSLCGVVSRNVVRLPCEHTLCSECHEESQRRGSTCPLDEESFADDNILHLDISGGYILNHTVACVNAPNGCDFIGQASRLVDHYKQCSFHVVPCPRCESSVLRTEIVGHCKDGCSSASTTPVPIPYYMNVNYDNLEITSSERKREMLKISEDLSRLQTSLNQWLEEVRTLEKNTNKELKDATLKISDHLSGLHT
ncbi:RING finger protein 151-like [Ixodes scapularis]